MLFFTKRSAKKPDDKSPDFIQNTSEIKCSLFCAIFIPTCHVLLNGGRALVLSVVVEAFGFALVIFWAVPLWNYLLTVNSDFCGKKISKPAAYSSGIFPGHGQKAE